MKKKQFQSKSSYGTCSNVCGEKCTLLTTRVSAAIIGSGDVLDGVEWTTLEIDGPYAAHIE